MTAPFAGDLFGWRNPRGSTRYVPNCSDSESTQSVLLAEKMLGALGIPQDPERNPPSDPGPLMERLVRQDLARVLPSMGSGRSWQIEQGRLITQFSQYAHLRGVDELVKVNAELRITIGRDYLIKPDVTVGIVDLDVLGGDPFLHAAISCKWTIRSDRVQNIRHECNQMVRHRRGRQPHLVTVTAEPLPSRLASIARGTGEVDAVYHIAFDALGVAVEEVGNAEQKAAWEECVEQKRLLSYEDLAETLARW